MTSILLVEDNLCFSRHCSSYFERKGHFVHTCLHGRSIEEIKGGLAYDVLVVDFHSDNGEVIREGNRVRVMTGNDVIQTSREYNRDVSVISISCYDGGFGEPDGYLTKPFKMEELEALIEMVVPRKKREVESRVGLGKRK